jgi:hypothetical protein
MAQKCNINFQKTDIKGKKFLKKAKKFTNRGLLLNFVLPTDFKFDKGEHFKANRKLIGHQHVLKSFDFFDKKSKYFSVFLTR